MPYTREQIDNGMRIAIKHLRESAGADYAMIADQCAVDVNALRDFAEERGDLTERQHGKVMSVLADVFTAEMEHQMRQNADAYISKTVAQWRGENL